MSLPTDAEPPTAESSPSRAQEGQAEHPTALAAYYTAIFALFPGTGLFMGPAAAIVGLKALAAIRQEPEAGGKRRAQVAVAIGVATTVLNWGAVLFFLLARLSGRF